MVLKINKEKCIACGGCINSCPEVFKYDADGKAEVIGNQTEIKNNSDQVAEAIKNCPVEAISDD